MGDRGVPHNQLLLDQTLWRQMVLHGNVSLLNSCTYSHMNHMHIPTLRTHTQTRTHLHIDVHFCPPAGEEQGSGIPAVPVVSKHIERGLLWRLTTS